MYTHQERHKIVLKTESKTLGLRLKQLTPGWLKLNLKVCLSFTGKTAVALTAVWHCFDNGGTKKWMKSDPA